jgi:hypothetical protein
VVAEVIVGIEEPGYHTLHLLLGSRGGPYMKNKASLLKGQEVSARGRHRAKDPSRKVQDLAVSRLLEGLADLPPTRGRARRCCTKPLHKPVAYTTRKNVTAGEPKLGIAGASVPASAHTGGSGLVLAHLTGSPGIVKSIIGEHLWFARDMLSRD